MSWKRVLGIVLIIMGTFIILTSRTISGSVIGVLDIISKVSFVLGVGLIAGGLGLIFTTKRPKLAELKREWKKDPKINP